MSLTEDEIRAVANNRFSMEIGPAWGIAAQMATEWSAAVEPVLRAKIAAEIRAITIPAWDESIGPVSAAADMRAEAAHVAEGAK